MAWRAYAEETARGGRRDRDRSRLGADLARTSAGSLPAGPAPQIPGTNWAEAGPGVQSATLARPARPETSPKLAPESSFRPRRIERLDLESSRQPRPITRHRARPAGSGGSFGHGRHLPSQW